MPGWFGKKKPPPYVDPLRGRCLVVGMKNGKATAACVKKRGHLGKHSWEK